MKRLLRHTGRYAQVGLLCAVLNNAIVIALDHAGVGYAAAVPVAFLLVMIVGYLLHAVYTFGVVPSTLGWVRFTGTNLLGFPMSMAFMFLLCDVLNLSTPLAMPIATGLLFAWNYILVSRLIDGSSRRSC